MSATGTVSVQQHDGTLAVGFVRGFACCPEPGRDSHASVSPAVHDGSAEPKPEFRLTTVQPGVAVEIEIGAFTRET